MVGPLLTPTEHLAEEVLRERIVCQAGGLVSGDFRDEVEFLDDDIASKILPDIIKDSLNTVNWVVLVKEDHVVFALH